MPQSNDPVLAEIEQEQNEKVLGTNIFCSLKSIRRFDKLQASVAIAWNNAWKQALFHALERVEQCFF